MATSARSHGPQGSPDTRSPITSPPDESVRRRLRTEGGRVTMARLLVLRVLTNADGHLGAQEIHARVNALADSITLSTVYRTLSRLEDLGLIHALPTVGETQFGLAHEPHHHAICTGCGKVSELPGATLTDILQALEQHTGYTFTDNSSLTMRALCEQCRHSRQRAQPPA